MIHLGKGAAVVLDAEGADGWAPTPGGITFRHQKERESGIIVPLQTKEEKS